MNEIPAPVTSVGKTLLARIEDRSAVIGIVGMGYVGLPLAFAVTGAGFRSIGFDISPERVADLNAGRSYIKTIPANKIAEMRKGDGFRASADFTEIASVDAILICVPTPLTRHREPDMSYVVGTATSLQPHLRPGQLVALESTTYPGTTDEVLRPILEKDGLKSGTDLFIAYSPEREDPGNINFTTSTIPKVVGGDGPDALSLACALYGAITNRVVPVSSTATAEAVKLTENIFRSVNIALVNELKTIYRAMDVNVWEVIDAAKTKPFGYMPFYPGPGLGGHCIPIDPFYLTWKAREFDLRTRFIELAGEINTMAPYQVVERLIEALNRRQGKSLKGMPVLLMGVAYKKNVDDMRESPALKLFELLEARGALVDFHDPFVPQIPETREHPEFAGRTSVSLTTEALAGYAVALICTDHDDVDYEAVVRCVPLVIDTRNVTRDLQGTYDNIELA
ncbi:UDP-N-acetyl-D-glucosamine 6-dehydrogenase [Oceanibacterium hippocampi]|uniref:UDP-N-acetyl-D-glucosamine 6-dehydrogenase n=2 Tax=Oceanibacterium hippocampi TaxID=745714 RepID=A0A1Y5RRN2_9PROT|nr:UDP-N-acetyl-D-glucosamine 6-dehydrogenase [Oceanibacterium hippocampi]